MTEYRKAPDGQPTENIELQLRTSEAKVKEHLRWRDDCQKKLESAQWMLDTEQHRRDELDWQLHQRKAQEVTGL